MNKRIRKKKASYAFRKFANVFENMVEPFIQVAENFDPSEFRTQEFKLRELVGKQFQGIENNRDTGDALKKLITHLDFFTQAKSANRELKNERNERAQKDSRFLELDKFVTYIDTRFPNIGFIPLFVINPMELFVRAFEPSDLIEDYKKFNGEKAARTLIRIYREIAELLYYDYLKAIFQLVQILEGKSEIKLSAQFGVLAEQLPVRLKKFGYHNLVDQDAGWLRNATCHGHWKYKPENHSLVLWDQKRPEKEMGVSELYEKAMRMYSMVIENYLPFILYYLKGKVLNEWLDFLKYFQKNFTSIINGDPKKNQRLEKMILEKFSVLKQIEFKKLNKSSE